MILVDFSQVAFAHIAIETATNKTTTVDEATIRHMIWNQIRSIHVKFRDEFGQMYLVYDGSPFWRHRIFDHYKGLRRKDREASLLDWKQIFEVVNTIMDEAKTNMPFPTIRASGAEADDVVAYFCRHFQNEPKLIISTDKDFRQLQFFPNVKQYRPTVKSLLKEKDPLGQLKDMVMRGDKGDGIPNVLTEDDCFMIGKRQAVLSKKRVADIMDHFSIEVHGGVPQIEFTLDCPQDLREKLQRNWNLICLVNESVVPKDVVENMGKEIDLAFDHNARPNLSFYFLKNGCKMLAERVEDFFPSKNHSIPKRGLDQFMN